MYQSITIVGNLGGDPEQRNTPSGVPVTNFNVAVNKSWTGQDGAKHEKTTWFRITTWRTLAETCKRYLTKGRQVLVVGEMEEAKAFQKKDGSMGAALEVTASVVRFIGPNGEHTDMPGVVEETSEAPAEDLPF